MKEDRKPERDFRRAARLERAELLRHKLGFRRREVRQNVNERFFFRNEVEFFWKPRLSHLVFQMFMYPRGQTPAKSTFSGFLAFLNRDCEPSENGFTSSQKRAIEHVLKVRVGEEHEGALPEVGRGLLVNERLELVRGDRRIGGQLFQSDERDQSVRNPRQVPENSAKAVRPSQLRQCILQDPSTEEHTRLALALEKCSEGLGETGLRRP
jgi:hypothetical protein